MAFPTYRKYILDSAIRYVERNLELARAMNSSYKVYQSKIQLAPLYSFSGMYIESQSILESIDTSLLPRDLLGKYYEAYIQFYDHYGTASYQDKYQQNKHALRDSLLRVTDPGSRTYRSNYVTVLMGSGDSTDYVKAERILTELLAETPEDTPDYASSTHQMAKIYQRQNRPELVKNITPFLL